MPKVPGLSAEQRKALVQDQMSDDDVEPIDLPAQAWPSPPPTANVPVAAALPNTDAAALIQMLVQALQQSGADTAQAIRDGLASATSMAREPIPENKVAPGFSVYAHPDGDQTTERTKLRCPMFLGIYDETGKATPAFEIFHDTCTEKERVALNQVRAGAFMVERNDGRSALWRVVEQMDDLGQPVRVVIAVPATWLSKDEQAQMPAQFNKAGNGFLQQINAAADMAAA